MRLVDDDAGWNMISAVLPKMVRTVLPSMAPFAIFWSKLKKVLLFAIRSGYMNVKSRHTNLW